MYRVQQKLSLHKRRKKTKYSSRSKKLYLCIDIGKKLSVWVTSQFQETDSDFTSYEKRLLPQEENHLNKNIILFVNKT
jgi:hypothetical protein